MTEPIGIFNFAESYRQAAKTLQAHGSSGTHPQAPMRHLFFHSCELFLKSFLAKSHTSEDLKKYGHKLGKLFNRANDLDLPAAPWAQYVFANYDFKSRSNDRYLTTGYYENQISNEALSYLSAELCNATHFALLEEYPIISREIQANTILSKESFVLPEALGRPPSIKY